MHSGLLRRVKTKKTEPAVPGADPADAEDRWTLRDDRSRWRTMFGSSSAHRQLRKLASRPEPAGSCDLAAQRRLQAICWVFRPAFSSSLRAAQRGDVFLLRSCKPMAAPLTTNGNRSRKTICLIALGAGAAREIRRGIRERTDKAFFVPMQPRSRETVDYDLSAEPLQGKRLRGERSMNRRRVILERMKAAQRVKSALILPSWRRFSHE